MMPLARRRFINHLQTHKAVWKPQLNICIRKDIFRNKQQLNNVSRLYEYIIQQTWNRNPYEKPICIPVLMPKTCRCQKSSGYHQTYCSCCPLESGIAIHVETMSDKASSTEVIVEAKDTVQINSMDRKDIVNLNVQTYVIVSDYLYKQDSFADQICLTFHDALSKQNCRTLGETIGVVGVSINDKSLYDTSVMEYDVNVIQASDKDLGIDNEWDRIKKWARNKGP